MEPPRSSQFMLHSSRGFSRATEASARLNRPETANSDRFPQTKLANHVRVMSANLHKGILNDSHCPILHSKVTAVFNRYMPDVLAMQEVCFWQLNAYQKALHQTGTFEPKVCGYLFENHTYKNAAFIQSFDDVKALSPENRRDHRSYNAIVYNSLTMQKVASGVYSLGKNIPEPQLWPQNEYMNSNMCGLEAEFVTWVVLRDLQSRKLWLVQTARFDSKTDGQLDCAEKAASKSKELMKEMSADVAVFTGDFNLFPSTKGKTSTGELAYRELNRHFKDIRDLGGRHFGPDGTFVGYNGGFVCKQNPHVPPTRQIRVLDRLDHMFMAGEGIQAVHEGVCSDCPDRSDLSAVPFPLHKPPNNLSKPETVSPSDHYFLFADVIVNKDAEPNSLLLQAANGIANLVI